jgi:hypothetical protein
MLVRFKKKDVEGVVEKPRPKPVLPPRDRDWNPNDVETPEPKRRLKSFEQKQEYVAIIEYRKNAKSGGPRIQKLNFKAEGGFAAAAQAAYKMATMVGKALAIDLHEIRNEQMCRVLGVFEIHSFKDWQNENTSLVKNTKHIDKAIKALKKDKMNPISYVNVTEVKVR